MADSNHQPYMVSSTYVGGFIRALRSLALLPPELEAKLGPALRAMIASPYAQGWWDGSLTEQLVTVILEQHGPDRLEEAGFFTTRNSVGPIITPLISVIGAIFGLRPSTLLDRVGDLASTSVRGVELSWTSTSETTGVLKIVYPAPHGGRLVEPLWRGSCRFIFEVSKANGKITESKVDGSAVTLTLSWDAKR